MQSSCSCTWAKSNDEFVGTVIAPKQKIDFPLFIHTGTLQDKANGKITITYKFQSDDSKLAGEQKFALAVNGTILPDYRIEPQNIRLGDVIALESRTAKATFRIVPVQLQSLEILKIKPSSPLLTTKILSSGQAGYEIEIQFDGSPLAVSENFSGSLIIETNSKKVPLGMVSVDAVYYAPVNISETEIIIPSDTEGQVKKTVRITSRVPLQIISTGSSADSLIQTAFDADAKSTEHSVTFSIEPCREAEIQETFNLKLLLFPKVGESISITCPVSVYRFYKGAKL
jgi:hypothetical protein